MKAYLIQYVLKSYLWIHHPLIRATTVLDHFLFICHKQHLWSDTHVIFPILAHWKGLLKIQNQNISNYYRKTQFHHIWIKATFSKLYTISTYFLEPQINTLRYCVFWFPHKAFDVSKLFLFFILWYHSMPISFKKVVSQKL